MAFSSEAPEGITHPTCVMGKFQNIVAVCICIPNNDVILVDSDIT